MDDSLTRTRLTPSEMIRELRENPTGLPKRPAAENPPGPPATDVAEEEFGPESYDPAGKDYKAFGWAGNKPVPGLRFIFKDQRERVCYYAHLDSRYPDGGEFIPSAPGRQGNVIKLRFAGHDAAFMVIIEGRNLRRLWEMIQGHLTPWVAEYPGDIDAEGDTAAVVKSISFEAAK